MSKATLRRNGTQMITLACKFSLGRDDLAQILSQGLMWNRLTQRVDYTVAFASRPSRAAIVRYARETIRDDGIWGVKWSDEAEAHDAVKKLAFELVDFRFPDLQKQPLRDKAQESKGTKRGQ